MLLTKLGTLKTDFQAEGGDWSTSIIWAKHAFTLGR